MRISIRQKLALAMALPLAALVVVTGLEVRATVDDARQVRDQAELAEAALGPDGLLSALQNEGRFATAYLVGLEAPLRLPVEDNADARGRTDDALEEFRRRTRASGGRALETYRSALDGLAGLEALRTDIDDYAGPRTLDDGMASANEVFERYGEVTEPFYRANERISGAIDDPELRTGTELVNLAAQQIDVGAELTRSLNFGLLTDGGIDPRTEVPAIGAALARYDLQFQSMTRGATGDYRAAGERLATAPRMAQYRQLVGDALINGRADVRALLDANTTTGDSEFVTFRDEVSEVLVARADRYADEAGARERRLVALALAIVVAAAIATWLTARSITRPLRSLTAQAMDVAHRRLPGVVREVLHRPLGDDVVLPPVEPVTVRTRDEVRDVAEALTSVQRTAVDLAVEQAFLHRTLADSFVNLGRRNQNLLSRQLDFIAQLESSEAEATSLASLFELDHLATRMRRNAESLLVLAGLQPPRTGTAPVGITDVVRAALAEIEGYERVDVRNVEPTTVVGAAAADLTHMLAELIENALTFSPPGRSVEVRGLARPDGYVLSIVDAGPGMSPAETEQANRRLTGEESYTVAPSTNLGHYVAGQLAARHGVAVRVDTLAGGGLVATITVPQALVALSSGLGHRPGPGHRPGAGRPSPEWPGPGAAPARPPAGFVPAVLAEDHPGELTSGP